MSTPHVSYTHYHQARLDTSFSYSPRNCAGNKTKSQLHGFEQTASELRRGIKAPGVRTIKMLGMIDQQALHELAEAEIEEQRATIRTRSRAHLRYLQIRQHSNDFVDSKILQRGIVKGPSMPRKM